MKSSTELPRKPIQRLLTILTDALPNLKFGRIKENNFTTTLGAGAVFKEGNVFNDNGKKIASFSIQLNGQYWVAQELREFIKELNDMADYLDKISE